MAFAASVSFERVRSHRVSCRLRERGWRRLPVETRSPGLPALKSGLPIVARLEALADQRTNVRVQMPSGKIDATPHATMPIVPLRLFDSAGACGEIPVLLSAATTDAPTAFKLLSTTVRCPVARAILWAWSATQALHAGASEPPKARLIAGWRCHGADLQRSLDWGTYVLVRCSKNDSSPRGPRCTIAHHE